MLKQMRKTNIKGFSLIELMVVVAIIGILAAVAVPNFQRFQRKARQSEAKTLLGGLHTAMETFRAEWEDYLGEFNDNGFAPNGLLQYSVGFSMAGAQPMEIGVYMNLGGASIETFAACGMDVPTCMSAPGVVALAVASTWTNANMGMADTFLASAEGEVGGTQQDRWTIDQVKQLQLTQDGTF